MPDKDLSIEVNVSVMKTKDIVIAIIALVIAYILFKMVWIFVNVIEIALILIVAYIVYMFLKKIL